MTKFETFIDSSACTLKKTNGETMYTIRVTTTNETTFKAIQELTRILMDADNEKPKVGTIFFRDGTEEDIVDYVHCKADNTVEFTSRTGFRYEYVEETIYTELERKSPRDLIFPSAITNHKFVRVHDGFVVPIDHIEIDMGCAK